MNGAVRPRRFPTVALSRAGSDALVPTKLDSFTDGRVGWKAGSAFAARAVQSAVRFFFPFLLFFPVLVLHYLFGWDWVLVGY
jgi:hypothetical protein